MPKPRLRTYNTLRSPRTTKEHSINHANEPENKRSSNKAAANYLIERNVPFVFPESSRKETDEGIFFSFLSPEALNPNLVVAPPIHVY